MNRAGEFLKAKDPLLGKIISQVGPCPIRPKENPSLYQALCRSIIYQQLATKAAKAIEGRFLALWPKGDWPLAADLEAAPISYLRQAGLSERKAEYLQAIAMMELSGEMPDPKQAKSMGEVQLKEILTAIKGVGEWTVDMLLIFELGLPDILPVTDYGVRKGHSLLYGEDLLNPKDLKKFGERWAPFRSTAAWYLWRVLDV